MSDFYGRKLSWPCAVNGRAVAVETQVVFRTQLDRFREHFKALVHFLKIGGANLGAGRPLQRLRWRHPSCDRRCMRGWKLTSQSNVPCRYKHPRHRGERREHANCNCVLRQTSSWPEAKGAKFLGSVSKAPGSSVGACSATLYLTTFQPRLTVGRDCFCRVYAVPRLRLAVKYGLE
jgi:hypothetical protein